MPKLIPPKATVPPEPRTGLSCVLDMSHGGLLDTSAIVESDAKTQVVHRRDSRGIRRALIKALNSGTLNVKVGYPIKDRKLTVEFDVRLERRQSPEAGKIYDQYTITLTPKGSKQSTKIVVAFGKALKQPGKGTAADAAGTWEHWINLRGNATTILSGQNVRPIEAMMRSLKDEVAFQLALPWLVLLSICKAAKPDFEEPQSVSAGVFNGQVVRQNIQLATKAAMLEPRRSTGLDLLHAGFTGMRVVSKNGKLETFELGKLLGITSTRYQSKDAGQESTHCVMLRKNSGAHQLASVSINCKRRPLGMSRIEARRADQLRVDVTLTSRGQRKLLVEAERVAKKAKVELKLERTVGRTRAGKGEIRCSDRNLSAALAIIDEHFVKAHNDVEHRGLRGWLTLRIVIELFHLDALLGFTPQRWRKVEGHFEKAAEREPRLGKGFKLWCASTGDNADLYGCLRKAGLSGDAAHKHSKIVAALGIPGEIPPRFWRHYQDSRLTWGASDNQLEKYHKSLKAGDQVTEQLATFRRQMRPVMEAAHKALTTFDQLALVPPAPVIAALPAPASVVPSGRLGRASSRKKLRRSSMHANAKADAPRRLKRAT